MIRLRLQTFGGGGSKSGTGTTNAVSSVAPGNHGSAGGRSMDNKEIQKVEKKSYTVSEPVRTIDARETYVLYDTKGKIINDNASGAELKRNQDNGKLRYNISYGKWVIKTSNKQIIIRRKKR